MLIHVFSQFYIPLIISVYFQEESGLDVLIQDAIILGSPPIFSLKTFFLGNLMSSSLSPFTLNVQIHDEMLFRIILDPFFNVLISSIGLLLSGWFISS